MGTVKYGAATIPMECGTTPYDGDPTGNPQVPVANAKAWATYLLNMTASHHDEMAQALAARNESHKIEHWSAKTKVWLESFALMTEKVYSAAKPYFCSGTVDIAPLYPCEVCCFSTSDACQPPGQVPKPC